MRSQTKSDGPATHGPPIVLVSLATVFGGGEIYLENLIRLLSPDVPSVVVCIHPEVKRRADKAGAHTIFIDLSQGWRRLLRIPFGLAAAARTRLQFRSARYLLNGFAPASIAAPLRLFARHVIVVGHLNLSERKTLLQRVLRHRRYLTSLRFASRIICVSNAVADELRALFPRKDIVAIPNWIPDIPAELPRRDPDNRLRLLFVGRITRLKGLRVLIEAMSTITGCELTVVGDGVDRDACERAATALPVRFAGFQKDPRDFYRHADCLVNPSFGPEGSSMVALEAMASGLPVIMSDIPVFREIAGNGQAALLFEVGSAKDLSEKVTSLKDPRARRRLVERGYEWVRARHSSQTARKHYFAALGVGASGNEQQEGP